MANSAPDTSGTSASAARAPSRTDAADQLLGGRVRDRRAGGDPVRVLARGGREALVRQHAVDHVPPLEDGGRIALTGEDQLPGPRRSGPLGQPLRPAHRRREPDDDLDQPERRLLGGQQDVAAQRQLERGGEGEPVRGEHRRHRQVLDRLRHPQQLRPELAAAGRGLRPLGDVPEEGDVDPAGHDLAAGLEQHRPGTVRPLRVGQCDQLRRRRRPAPWNTAGVNRFSGGFSRTTTATSPSRSIRMGAGVSVTGPTLSPLRLPGRGKARQPGGHAIRRPPRTCRWMWSTDCPACGPVLVTTR